jgi:TusA-related sulfurtransferase
LRKLYGLISLEWRLGMTKLVDYRGLACPQPAIETNKSAAEAQKVTTMVENATAKVKVSRMATKEGCSL